LKEVEDADSSLWRLAAKRPENTREMYEIYLSDRRRTLVSTIDQMTSFDAIKLGHQVRALIVIGKLIGDILGEKIELKPNVVMDPKPPEGESRESYSDRMYELFLPQKHKKRINDDLAQTYLDAEEGIIRGEDIERWQALHMEIGALKWTISNCGKLSAVIDERAQERATYARRYSAS
jgi:hypothetical protein